MRLSALVKGQLLAFPERIIYNTWHCVVGLQVFVWDRIGKQYLRLGEAIAVLATIHHASGCLEIEDHSRTNHFFWRDGGS